MPNVQSTSSTNIITEEISNELKTWGFRYTYQINHDNLEESIARRMPKRRRRGIYVIRFQAQTSVTTNSTTTSKQVSLYYAGKSINVANRFTQHRRNYKETLLSNKTNFTDVRFVEISFRPTNKKELDREEKSVVHRLEKFESKYNPTEFVLLNNIRFINTLLQEQDDLEETKAKTQPQVRTQAQNHERPKSIASKKKSNKRREPQPVTLVSIPLATQIEAAKITQAYLQVAFDEKTRQERAGQLWVCEKLDGLKDAYGAGQFKVYAGDQRVFFVTFSGGKLRYWLYIANTPSAKTKAKEINAFYKKYDYRISAFSHDLLDKDEKQFILYAIDTPTMQNLLTEPIIITSIRTLNERLIKRLTQQETAGLGISKYSHLHTEIQD